MIQVKTVISTPSTSRLRVGDLTELLAACALHRIGPDGEIECVISDQSDERTTYFSLVAYAPVTEPS